MHRKSGQYHFLNLFGGRGGGIPLYLPRSKIEFSETYVIFRCIGCGIYYKNKQAM